MIGPGFADEIGRSILRAIIVLMVGSFILGMMSMWLAPKFWAWLKPIIHSLTV